MRLGLLLLLLLLSVFFSTGAARFSSSFVGRFGIFGRSCSGDVQSITSLFGIVSRNWTYDPCRLSFRPGIHIRFLACCLASIGRYRLAHQ